ncbi:F-box domain-containing protein [Mycena indigotica]|uniref:guanosine-diphosphatase n=1 Tax=Mycena indigotica TaxID=2126181 RepID=A0A8H6W7W6_9AGAR|nr:F-box domain-containing protein [Mycena indigotica]KAF7306241.1 F-box domain-containing protein [Mycena indigotica]
MMKYTGLLDETAPPVHKLPPRFWRKRLLLGLGLSLAMWYTTVHKEELMSALEQEEPSLANTAASSRYAIIIDGDSTGTRLHIHNFSSSLQYRSTISYQTAVENSLHAYAEQSMNAKEAFQPLIRYAMDVIPADQHACTPLLMRASSRSLRSLGQPQRDNLLHSVERILQSRSPFPVALGSVEIMKPGEDIMFSWVAARHLLEDSNIAVLLLSESDTQLVFEPSMGFDDDKYPIRLGNRTHDLYRRIFEHNGLRSLRQQVNERVAALVAISGTPTAVVSNPCIAKDTSEHMTIRLGSQDRPQGDEYLMDGTTIGGYDACSTVVDDVLAKTFHNANILPIDHPTPIWLKRQFTDRIAPLLVDNDPEPERGLQAITVDKIAWLARAVCAGPEVWADVWGESEIVDRLARMPSWCLDLTIIHRLLTTGYRLDGRREVLVGHGVGDTAKSPTWTIGAAVQLIQNTAANYLLYQYFTVFSFVRDSNHETVTEAFSQKTAMSAAFFSPHAATPRPNPLASALRARLHSIDTQCAETHAKIAQLRTHLKVLAQRRKEVAKELKEKIVFPILTIPPEITSQIFFYYAEYLYDVMGLSPLVLTHVCHVWRDIALSTPKIWTMIHMPGFDDETSGSLPAELMLRRCLERAGPSSLRITAPFSPAPRLFSLLTVYSNQIASLSCHIPLPDNCSLDGISGCLSRMTHLDLTIRQQHAPITIFSNAPSLRRLTMCYMTQSPGQVDLPWEQLVEVTIQNVDFNPDVLDLVAKMSRLEVLTIPCAPYRTMAHRSVVLPRLRELDCSAFVSSNSTDFLRSFKCPHLETFNINFENHDGAGNAVQHFLSSGNSLRHLMLSRVTTEIAFKLFRYTPTVEKLSIADSQQMELLWHNLAFSTRRIGNPLPALKELEVEVPRVDIPYRSIVSLIHPRACHLELSDIQRISFNMPFRGFGSISTRIQQFAAEPENGRIGGCKIELSGLARLALGAVSHEQFPLYSLADVDNES